MSNETTFLAFIACKGGVTKTTLTAHIGAVLASHGKSVILVESDGQGSLSKLVGVPAQDGFAHLISENAEWDDVLVRVPPTFCDGAIWALPSGNANLRVAADPETPARIIERFAELRDHADYVLIDTSPAIDQINASWFYVADWLLLPTLVERASLDQLIGNTLGYVRSATSNAKRAGMTPARIRGVIPNRASFRAEVQRVNYAELQRLGDQMRVFPAMREAAIYNTAAQLKTSITSLSNDNDGNLRRQARHALVDLQPIVDSLLVLQPEVAVA